MQARLTAHKMRPNFQLKGQLRAPKKLDNVPMLKSSGLCEVLWQPQQPNSQTTKHGQRQLKNQQANLKLRCPQLHLSRCQFVFLFLISSIFFLFFPYKLGHSRPSSNTNII